MNCTAHITFPRTRAKPSHPHSALQHPCMAIQGPTEPFSEQEINISAFKWSTLLLPPLEANIAEKTACTSHHLGSLSELSNPTPDTHTWASNWKLSLERNPWGQVTIPKQIPLLTEATPSLNSTDIITSDLMILGLGWWQVHSRKGPQLHQHSLTSVTQNESSSALCGCPALGQS